MKDKRSGKQTRMYSGMYCSSDRCCRTGSSSGMWSCTRSRMNSGNLPDNLPDSLPGSRSGSHRRRYSSGSLSHMYSGMYRRTDSLIHSCSCIRSRMNSDNLPDSLSGSLSGSHSGNYRRHYSSGSLSGRCSDRYCRTGSSSGMWSCIRFRMNSGNSPGSLSGMWTGRQSDNLPDSRCRRSYQ